MRSTRAGGECCFVLLAMLGACGSGQIDGDDDTVGDDDDDVAMPADADPGAPDGAPPADAAPPSDAPDSLCEQNNAGERTAPDFGAPSINPSGLLVRVMNNCSFPLWIHGQGNDGAGGTNVLSPDDAELGPGETQDYDGHATLGSARVTAYIDGPRQNEIQFVELNFGNGELGYNISYVDYLGLPVEVDATCGTTACYAPAATVLDGCPEHLREADRCRSPGGWCNDPAHHGDPYCGVLDGEAQAALQLPRCQQDLASWQAAGHEGDPIGTTPSVYACRDFWGASAFCCAVVNRGVVSEAEPQDICQFYVNPPFNTYARWVHERCPEIYAFPYDDAADQGGYHQCATDELRITWCPGG
jgi:glycosyl hydrolase family 64 (putative beta-1,3-glucanase)